MFVLTMQLLLLPFQFLSVSSREHTMDLITLNFLEIPSTLMTKPLISTFGNYQEIPEGCDAAWAAWSSGSKVFPGSCLMLLNV